MGKQPQAKIGQHRTNHYLSSHSRKQSPVIKMELIDDLTPQFIIQIASLCSFLGGLFLGRDNRSIVSFKHFEECLICARVHPENTLPATTRKF